MAANNTTNVLMDAVSLTNTSSATAALTNATILETLQTIPSTLWRDKNTLLLELRIIISAVACIYIGSFGALRRPPSAAVPKKKTKGKGQGRSQVREERDDQYVQGLMPSDAFMFPLLAGTVLVGLYYLIKWLEDPEILNRILKAYFSVMSIGSLSKLYADALHFLSGLAFPTVWTGLWSGRLYHVDHKGRGQWHVEEKKKNGHDKPVRVWDESMESPFPGLFSWLASTRTLKIFFWVLREKFRGPFWEVSVYLRRHVNDKFDLQLNDILGIMLALATNFVYHFFPPSDLLSNVLGYAFSYTSIILLSPTTFVTGSSVLFGLFFYDIFMVFYTPYMVTVATKLDAPVKLVFNNAGRSSMLGLGDIVIPGMFIGLCLRFDHYMHYRKQMKLEPIHLRKTEMRGGDQPVGTKTSTEVQLKVVKPEYVNPQGQWGDYIWTLATTMNPWRSFPIDTPRPLRASMFPKPYFYAALMGYLLALEVTLIMLVVFKHGQPALLYLVPGVVLSVWLTGLTRGEIREMWEYTEDGSLDKTDVVVELDGQGRVIRELGGKEDERKTKEGKKDAERDAERDAIRAEEIEFRRRHEMMHETRRAAATAGRVDEMTDTDEGPMIQPEPLPFFRLAIDFPAR